MLLKKMRTEHHSRTGLAFGLAFIVMMSMLTMGAIFDREAAVTVTLVQKDIFNDVENTNQIVTDIVTVEEFLNEQGIILGEDDVVDTELSSEVYSGQMITLEKSRMAGINVDGKTRFERTMKRTVGEFLEDSGIALAETDIVTPSKETVITSDMIITVTKVGVFEETVEIPYNSVTKEDSSLYVGETVVEQYGVKGLRKDSYRVVLSEGKEISRELISSQKEREPVDEVILSGTKQKQTVVEKKQAVVKENTDFKKAKEETTQTQLTHSKGFAYSNAFTVNATAYDPTLGGKTTGGVRTAYGLVAERGVVAVDPSIIPLGTRLYIESADGGASWVYGYCVAGDTGGAIKGMKVDLCFNTYDECISFGRQSATVYVLN